MGKNRICPRCEGTGRRGVELCQACNPSGAIGDRIVGAGKRAADRLAGRSIQLTPHGQIEKSRGRVTVRPLPGGVAPRSASGRNPAACDECGQVGQTLTLKRRGALCPTCR